MTKTVYGFDFGEKDHSVIVKAEYENGVLKIRNIRRFSQKTSFLSKLKRFWIGRWQLFCLVGLHRWAPVERGEPEDRYMDLLSKECKMCGKLKKWPYSLVYPRKS